MDFELTNQAQESVKAAMGLAKSNGNALTEPLHLMLALIESDYGQRMLRRAEIMAEEDLKT